MADRHAIIKNGCQGNRLRPRQGHHLHGQVGLWHGRQLLPRPPVAVVGGRQAPLFFDKAGEHGMSETMKHYLAGQLAHAGEITYFLAPYINSYKRFMAGTFAPTRAVWSFDNRTAGYRICGADTKAIRVECRIGGADLNPYLAFAALIAAGLDGIEKKMKLEPVFSGDAYDTSKKLREIPKTLREASGAARRVEVPARRDGR